MSKERTFVEFARSLPATVLNKLYSQPTTCIAVFRELPVLARHIVTRILFVEHPVPKKVVHSWVNAEHQSEQMSSCEKLTQLKIWHEIQLPGGLIAYKLNDSFRQNFQTALLAEDDIQPSTAVLGPDKYAKDVPFLDSYANERWECILHFMVDSREGNQTVSKEMADILVQSGLMKRDNPAIPPMITAQGFHFLLMDRASQIWYFLQQYLSAAEERRMNLVDCITFLLQISFSTLGNDSPTEDLTETQMRFLIHLRELGLIFIRKKTSQRFYPTRLAVNVVAGGQTKSAADAKQKGFIVVETNYRVYAYTDSQLQIALLGLFCEMLYRFPNMVVGNITRDSVRQALMHGIKSEQIINYLMMHSHSQMLSSRPVLPPTIIDQIRLWEIERDRFEFTDGMLYNQFLSQSEFEIIRDYAKDIGVLIFENDRSKTIVVTKQGHDPVRKFWKRQKKS